MIKGIAFDMDGLMFDTEQLAIYGWQHAGELLGYPITKEMVLKTFGLNKENTRKVWEEYFGTEFPNEKALKIRQDYAEELIEKNGLPVKKGLYSLISFLKENGIRFTIATSSDEKKVRRYLKQVGLSTDFGEIVCGDKIAHGKPEPDIYLKAAEVMGLEPKDCIALEDSAAGILSAFRAGMKPVMIPDILSPDKETEALIYKKLDSLEEVISFLLQENN